MMFKNYGRDKGMLLKIKSDFCVGLNDIVLVFGPPFDLMYTPSEFRLPYL